VRVGAEHGDADASRAPAAGANGGGYGLAGMRERAELIGGTLSAGVTPTGFRVELEVPE
jgi:signal transduction histidine kinase